MLLWLRLQRLANQPTITCVALCQQGWTSLLNTKTEESVCAHIGGESLNVCQSAGNNDVTSHKYTSHTINILHTQYTNVSPNSQNFTPNTHSSYQVHIFHPQQTFLTPNTHNSHAINKLHTQYTHFTTNTHTIHTVYIPVSPFNI